MTIIGVTNEPASRIRPFIKEKKMKYTVAIGAARDYATTGIPRAWLVDARGKVVWEGHPRELKDSMIQEHLRAVNLPPRFNLTARGLEQANKSLNAGKLGSGVTSLDRYLKRPKSEEGEAEAKAARKKVVAYAKGLLKKAGKSADQGDMVTALGALAEFEKRFKGHKFAKKAKDKRDAWNDDPEMKLEVAAAKIIIRAEALADAGAYKAAGGALVKVVRGRKYKETKTRQKAEELLEEVMKQLRRG